MSHPTWQPKRILVTGSAGHIGKSTCRELIRRGHTVRGFDRVQSPMDDAVVGLISDRDAVDAAMRDCDCVVHLAAQPDEADFMTVLLEPNIVGVYHVCSLALAHKVRRLVLTSTVMVTQGNDTSKRTVRVTDRAEPRTHYACTKMFAEAMGTMYAGLGLSVVTIRPAWCIRNRRQFESLEGKPRSQAEYFSIADAGRCFACAAESLTPEDGQHAVLFGSSKSPVFVPYDLEPARQVIGYEPRDTWPQGWIDQDN